MCVSGWCGFQETCIYGLYGPISVRLRTSHPRFWRLLRYVCFGLVRVPRNMYWLYGPGEDSDRCKVPSFPHIHATPCIPRCVCVCIPLWRFVACQSPRSLRPSHAMHDSPVVDATLASRIHFEVGHGVRTWAFTSTLKNTCGLPNEKPSPDRV